MDWLERLNRGPDRMLFGSGVLEVVGWGHVPRLYEEPAHRHAFFEVSLVGPGGSGWLHVDEVGHPLRAGDLSIARPGVVHRLASRSGQPLELLQVGFRWAAPSVGTLDETAALVTSFSRAETVVAADVGNRVLSLWNSLRAVASGPPRPALEPQVVAQVTALLLAIVQAGVGQHEVPAAEVTRPYLGAATVQLAVRYIHGNHPRPISVPDIAEEVHVSPRHLCRLFAQFTGDSPAAYIARTRLEWARSLLVRTDRPVKEIAASVGYPDVHYFTRAFTRHFGCPPARYRRRSVPSAGVIVQKSGLRV